MSSVGQIEKLSKTGESSGEATEEPGTYGGKPSESINDLVEKILELVKNQCEY